MRTAQTSNYFVYSSRQGDYIGSNNRHLQDDARNAFGLHRLEATAPWGVRQENQNEEKVTLSDKEKTPTDSAHFAMLSRGNCWLSVEGVSEPIPLTGGDCFSLAPGTSIVLRDSPRTRPRGLSARSAPAPTAMSLCVAEVAHRRPSSVDP